MTDVVADRGTGARRFAATPSNVREARRFVTEAAAHLGWADGVVDDAVLCVGELASNAVLHTRAPFEIALASTGDGLRVLVTDSRPADLPFALSAVGYEHRIIDEAVTGRGLRIVAALARRWGVTTTPTAKTVWAEFDGSPDSGGATAVVVIGHDAPPSAVRDVVLTLRHLPALAAVGSGLQTDGLVREIQLGLFDEAIDDAERTRFYDLLDASAPARLSGRHAALTAIGAGARRFDLEVPISQTMIAAVSALSHLLTELPAKQPLTTAAPSQAVLDFRDWLADEVAAQLGGAAPRVCPLPD